MKMRAGIVLTAGVIFASVLLGYLLYTSFQPVSDLDHLQPPVGEEIPDSSGTKPPALRLEQTEVALVDQDNRLCWQLRLATMEKEGTTFALDGVTGEYFTPAGEALAVQAKKGTVSEDFSRLCLQEVKIVGEELTVTAGELEWTTAPGGVLSGEEIVMKNREIEVCADRFQADPGLEQVVVDGHSRWKFPAR